MAHIPLVRNSHADQPNTGREAGERGEVGGGSRNIHTPCPKQEREIIPSVTDHLLWVYTFLPFSFRITHPLARNVPHPIMVSGAHLKIS